MVSLACPWVKSATLLEADLVSNISIWMIVLFDHLSLNMHCHFTSTKLFFFFAYSPCTVLYIPIHFITVYSLSSVC